MEILGNAMVICAISIFALCDNNYLIGSRSNGQMKGVERMKNVDGTNRQDISFSRSKIHPFP